VFEQVEQVQEKGQQDGVVVRLYHDVESRSQWQSYLQDLGLAALLPLLKGQGLLNS
jgi:hypothetical protein